MKDELKRSSERHSSRLISDLAEVIDLPNIAVDRIRREVDYATMDGYRITMKHNTEKDKDNDKTNKE